MLVTETKLPMYKGRVLRLKTLRVVVFEPNDPLRQAIKWVLSHNHRCWLVGEARSEEEALVELVEAEPDIVLVDVSAGAGGMATLGRLAGAFPATRMVALLSEYSDEYRSSAHAHGAFACVAKEHLEEHLAWAVQKVLAAVGAEVSLLEEASGDQG